VYGKPQKKYTMSTLQDNFKQTSSKTRFLRNVCALERGFKKNFMLIYTWLVGRRAYKDDGT